MAKGGQADVVITVGMALKQLKRDAAQAKKVIKNGLMGNSATGVDAGLKSFNRVQSRIDGINKAIRPAQKAFSGWALSIMFFGMAMRRVFDSIWKSSQKTFQEVMHSVDGTVTGFDILQGSLAYLGFTAGQALEPLAQMLVPIIDRLTEWISNNEELFRGVMVGLFVFGSLLTLLGTLKLAFDGLFNLAIVLGPAIEGIGAALAGVSAGTLAVVIAAVIALWVAWKTNLGNIQGFVTSTFAVIWDTIKSVAYNIGQIFKGLFEFLEGLFTGDFDKMSKGLLRVLINLVFGILKLVAGIGSALQNLSILVINIVKDLIFSAITLLMGQIQSMLRGIDRIAGTDLAGKMQSAIDKVNDWKAAATIDYTSADENAQMMAMLDKMQQKVEVFVELDGEKVADSVSTRQLQSTN